MNYWGSLIDYIPKAIRGLYINMNEDFFDGDRKEEEEFQGYSEIEAGHSNNAPDQAFQQPQLSTAFSGEIDYA